MRLTANNFIQVVRRNEFDNSQKYQPLQDFEQYSWRCALLLVQAKPR